MAYKHWNILLLSMVDVNVGDSVNKLVVLLIFKFGMNFVSPIR